MRKIPLKHLALSYAGYYGLTFEEFLRHAVELGCGAVQLIPDQSPNLYSDFSVARVKHLRKQLDEFGLAVSLHNVFYDINLLSLVPDVCNYSFQITEKVLSLASRLGAKDVTVHPGYMFPGWRNDARQNERFWEHSHQSLEQLSNLGTRYGINVLLENGSYYLTTRSAVSSIPFHVGGSVEEMGRLLRNAPRNIGLCLDVGKAIESGERLSTFTSTFGNRIKQVQVGGPRSLRAALKDPLIQHCITKERWYVVFEGGQSKLRSLKKLVTLSHSGS